MSNDADFTSTVVLQGTSAKFSITLTIQDMNDLKQVFNQGAEGLTPNMQTVIRFEDEDYNFVREQSISAWSDQFFDLRDISLCLAHLAEKPDTTERIADVGAPRPYDHRVIWAMYEDFFDFQVLLFSKDTRWSVGERCLKFIFYLDEANPDSATLVHCDVSVDEIRSFARELYELYTEFDDLRTNFSRSHPEAFDP